MAAAEQGPQFTAGETKLIIEVFKNLKSKADVHWDNVAAALGYKSRSVVITRFSQISRKFLKLSNENGGATDQSPKGNSNPRKRKAPAGDEPKHKSKVPKAKQTISKEPDSESETESKELKDELEDDDVLALEDTDFKEEEPVA